MNRVLLTAAEKIGWPTPGDYVLHPSADRKAFEYAFSNLLNLQSMYVTSFCVTYSVVDRRKVAKIFFL